MSPFGYVRRGAFDVQSRKRTEHRGSAAGSIVSYCLRITDLDPLEYGLIL